MSTLEAVRLYSVASVADLLEVSRVWVYERINSGELAVVELGTTRPKQRIRADVLQAFIDGRSFGSTPATPSSAAPSPQGPGEGVPTSSASGVPEAPESDPLTTAA